MVKQKNRPELRFPEFEDEWEKKKFGEVIEESGYGPRFSGEDYDLKGNVKTIRGTDVSLNGEILYEQVPLAFLKEDFIKNHILQDGDLVMITTAECGLTGVFRKQDINYIPSAYAVKLRLKESSNANFFKYLLQTKLADDQVNKFVRKATVANLPGSDILKFKFCLPLFSEQTLIANFFTAVDEKLDQLKKKKINLKLYKKGLMQKLFSQELRFKDEGGKEFVKWDKFKLGDLCKIKKGEQLNVSELTEYGLYPALNGGINISGYTDKWNTEKNVISISEGGNSCGYVNFNKERFWSGGHCYTIINVIPAVSNSYLYSFLKFREPSLMRLRVGSGLPNIQKNDLADFIIDIPSFKEQTLIANFLSALDEKIDQVQQQIEKTELWKKGLLQKMFC